MSPVISTAEMDRRWALVRAAMATAGLDWLIASTGHPFGYGRWLTNRFAMGGPLVAMPVEGAVLLASHGDDVHTLAQDSYGVRHLVSCAQLNMMVNSHAPLLVAEMRQRPVRRIGLLGTGFIPVSSYQIIQAAFPDAAIIDATDLVAPIKAVKSAEEMACMRAAAALHDLAVEVARSTVRAGITARDVLEEVRFAVNKAGSPTQTMMAGSASPGTICRYAGPADRVIQPGDQFAMLIECAEKNGYYSEAMPTICVGGIPPALQKAFDDTIEIQEELAAMLRPGLLPSALLTANDAFMEARGYPPEKRLLGHSQGLDLVERPAFSPAGENLAIQHDMVISIHPTVHAPQAWGYPNNMSFHFTARGTTRMLQTPQQIFVV
jgi:Xaa-Pro aminopeptidase